VWKLGARYSGFSVPDTRTKLSTCGLPIDHTASGYGLAVGHVEAAAFDDATFDVDATPLEDLRPLMHMTGNHFTTAAAGYELPYLT
jgi:hypothetical protein